jgi:predicted alpha/beta-fold hydrolase
MITTTAKFSILAVAAIAVLYIIQRRRRQRKNAGPSAEDLPFSQESVDSEQDVVHDENAPQCCSSNEGEGCGDSCECKEEPKPLGGLPKKQYLALKKAGLLPKKVTRSSDVRDLISSLASKPRIAIYFGTQTGNAELYAKQVADDAGERGFEALLFDLGRCEPHKVLLEKFFVIVVSTWTNGRYPTISLRAI